MRPAALLLLGVALLVLAGCSPARSPSGLFTVKTDGDVELKASVAQAAFRADAVPTVDVEVRNTGKSSIQFVRFNGCDLGFQVRMEPGTGQFVEKRDISPRGCTEAIEFAELKPGASIKASYVYQSVSGKPALEPGEHRITVRFNRGADHDSLEPVTVALKVTVTGGQ